MQADMESTLQGSSKDLLKRQLQKTQLRRESTEEEPEEIGGKEKKRRSERPPEPEGPPPRREDSEWRPREPGYPPPERAPGRGWQGALPVSDHPNKGIVKKAKQELFARRCQR
eukprot:s179_g32.t1